VVEALASDVRHPLDATLIDPQQFSTLDAATLTELTGRHRIIVTLEDGQLEGGWGDKVTAFYANAGLRDMRVLNFGAAKEFTDRVPLDALYRFGFGGYLLLESYSWTSRGFPGLWPDVWKPVLLGIGMILLEFFLFWRIWRRKMKA